MKRFLPLIALTFLAGTAALAESAVVVKVLDGSPAAQRWSAEDFANAKPLPLPRAELDAARLAALPPKTEAVADEAPFEEIFPSSAKGPTLAAAERRRFRRVLFNLSREKQPGGGKPAVAPKNFGSLGLDYTSSRLIPATASEVFPYSPVGKLFFFDGDDEFACTAAVITRRLVLTAGHCVHDGPGRGFFEDFTFAPGFRDGVAPFGIWEFSTVFVSSVWTQSGEVPNAEDWALLESVDQDGSRISEVVGKLAFVAELLADNHLHLLGYPGNLDGGQQMHQITSGDFIFAGDNTVVYGSDMEEGSSGGPWIQNFNRKSQGQGGGRNRARAAVVGVTSYGFSTPAPRVQGASIFTRNFKVLRQQACFNQTGNC